MSEKTRKATVYRRNGTPAVSTVEAYLPGNYAVTAFDEDTIAIEGTDNAGWTLDGYVIPRLGSGLISAREDS